MKPNLAKLTFYERTPFSQVPQFARIQAIVKNVAEARKIHIIDFCWFLDPLKPQLD